MLRKLRERMSEERGFTLIELLVVILIIGILAAIALPAFLGQQKKGQDSNAKSDARNMVSQVESCFADTQSYAACDTAAELGNTGLDVGSGAGQVEVQTASIGTDQYRVVAYSKNASHTFTIKKLSDGTLSRVCGSPGDGGCKNSGGSGVW